MNKIPLALAALLLGAGCVVRSVQPWLSDETRVAEPSLLGTWHDAKSEVDAFFTESDAAGTDYRVLLVGNGKDVLRYAATLHRIDDVLLLEVGPDDSVELDGFVLLPCHLLFKAVLKDDGLAFFPVDVDSFGERAGQAHLSLLPPAVSNEKPSVLTDATAAIETFVRAQLADPDFFDAKPLYSFRKLPPAPAP